MTNEICPECNKKSLRFRVSTNEYVCGNCKITFDKNKKKHRVQDALIDEHGNYYKVIFENEPGIIRRIETYYLESGKTTLRGTHSKLKSDFDCKYPERLSCNYEIGSKRCEFMEYERDGNGLSGHWKCTYKIKN